MYITFYRPQEYKGFGPSQVTLGPYASITNNGDGTILVEDKVLVECKVTPRGVEFPVYLEEPWTEFIMHEAPESGLDLPVKPT